MPRYPFTEDQIARAKEMNLLEYLECFERHELKRVGRKYTMRSHDSMTIHPDGYWLRYSTGAKGRSALDYLIKVVGMAFTEAMRRMLDITDGAPLPPLPYRRKEPILSKEERRALFRLPDACSNNVRVREYLAGRCIARAVVDACIDSGVLYEEAKYHNCVFVGKDREGVPRYAFMRGTMPRRFVHEVEGSNKRYAFSVEGREGATELRLFEAAIDLLSDMTLDLLDGKDCADVHRCEMGGFSYEVIYEMLERHPEVDTVSVRVANDERGVPMVKPIMAEIHAWAAKNGREIRVVADLPLPGLDYNKHLEKEIERRYSASLGGRRFSDTGKGVCR